jgi:predicted dienelactone hydrolase
MNDSVEYDPFVRGRFPVGVRTIQALDTVRNRLFPCEIWYPAAAQHAGQDIAPATRDFFTVPLGDTPRSQMAVRNAAAQSGTYPLIIFSHPGGGHRRTATFLCTHLSSHGYVVAALDHSEEAHGSQPRLPVAKFFARRSHHPYAPVPLRRSQSDLTPRPDTRGCLSEYKETWPPVGARHYGARK